MSGSTIEPPSASRTSPQKRRDRPSHYAGGGSTGPAPDSDFVRLGRAMKLNDEIDLTSVPVATLEAMLKAGEAVCECRQALRNSGDNVVSELLKGEETFYELKRYPAGGVYDKRSRSLFYYHAHPTAEQRDEHGHFHTFLRSQKLPAGATNGNSSQNPIDDLHGHIVAISMDRSGTPTKLFTTNRWVTDEVWHDATETCQFLERFAINHAQPSWLVNRWLTNLLILFGPQISLLILARDQKIASQRERNPERDPLDDRDLEIASEMEIDVDRHLTAVRSALEKQKASVAAAEKAAHRDALEDQVKTLRDDLAEAQTKVAARDRDIEAARKDAEAAIVRKYAGDIRKLQESYAQEAKNLAAAADKRVAQDIDSKLAEARSTWDAEVESKLQEWNKSNQDAIARQQKSAIADARSEWEREKQKTLAEAATEWQAAEAQRLAQAKAQWAIAQRDALIERDEQWQAEFDRQMSQLQTVGRSPGQTSAADHGSASTDADHLQADNENSRQSALGPRIALVLVLFVALLGGGIYLVPGAKSKLADRLQPLMTNIRAEAMELRKVFGPKDVPDIVAAPVAGDSDAPSVLQPTYIQPSAANLRASPSTGANVVAIMPRGVRVESLEVRNGWVRVRSTGPDSKDGWVHGSLLTTAPPK